MTKRKLMIDDKNWQYQIGRRNAVIWSPNGEKTVVAFERLIGEDEVKRRILARRLHLEQIWEENNYKGFAITPKDIRGFIDAALSCLATTSVASCK